MHEFATTKALLEASLKEARKRKAKKINSIELEIGDFTLLNPEQVETCFDAIRGEFDETAKAELIIKRIKGKIKCSCGYEGVADLDQIPLPICPNCGIIAEVTGGRECTIRRMRLEL